MKKLLTLILLVLLATPCYAFMSSYTVASGTWSPTDPASGLHHYRNTSRYKLELEATSNGSGNASITISDLGMLDIAGYSCVVVDPDGTDTPDDNFDLSIKDSNGREILTGGQGTNSPTWETRRRQLLRSCLMFTIRSNLFADNLLGGGLNEENVCSLDDAFAVARGGVGNYLYCRS